MTAVKDQRITNETVGREFFDILNIKKQIATEQLTFIGKVARNSENHLPTKLLTVWYKHKGRREGVLYANKNPYFTNSDSSYQ